MNGLNDEAMAPQTFLYGCTLEAGKEVTFNPDDDDLEHQLELKLACVDPSTSDEIHLVEVEGQDAEGQTIKAGLVTLKPSTLPSVCLGGFTITPPAVFRLKAGAGPIHLSGQHLVMMETDNSFDEDDDDEAEEVEELKTSKKRPASSPAAKSQKKMKMEVEEDDDDEDDEDDEEDDSEDEESPAKVKPAAAGKQKAAAQNGKSAAPTTPPAKKEKSPKAKGEKSPKSPKQNLTTPEIKAKMLESVKKGVSLPKAQPKFENYLKHGYKVVDAKVVAELWKWRQTLKDEK